MESSHPPRFFVLDEYLSNYKEIELGNALAFRESVKIRILR